MGLFRFSAPEVGILADHAGLFSSKDAGRVERSLSGFTEKFPQFDFRVITVDLDPALDLRLFAFWLLNVMPVPEDEDPARREWSLLLVIRPDFEMALVAGYAAEVWVSESDWTELLRDLRGQTAFEPLAKGLGDFLDGASGKLVEAWQRVEDRRRFRRSRTVRR